MPVYTSILENFKLVIAEVLGQVQLTRQLLQDSAEQKRLLFQISSKDDYIDNLKTTIEDECFSSICHIDPENVQAVNNSRAIHIICLNLERIADFCVNIARQSEYLKDKSFIQHYDYSDMFEEIEKSISHILPVFQKKDLIGALEICKTELSIDRMYKTNFDYIMTALRNTIEVEDSVTTIFIFRYIERIGDALLNIGEAVIFSIIGERIKIRQFVALEKTLHDSGFDGTLTDIEFRAIKGSRSGCQIGRISSDHYTPTKAQGIFKEGAIQKINKEKKNIEQWNSIYPGIAPRVYGYYEKSDTASLFMELFPGCTFDEIILNADEEIVHNASYILENILLSVFEKTRKESGKKPDFMRQLSSRLADIKKVHPHLYRSEQHLDGFKVVSSNELLDRCREKEQTLRRPFDVFIHGDFNTNNIIYDHSNQEVHFIDTHRSDWGDYVQDASVFLISNFRLPFFEDRQRQRLNETIENFYHFYQQLAETMDDKDFEYRMAFALARSFYTSTRFELNDEFAQNMILRSHFLMEKIIQHNDAPASFRLPEDILYY